MTEKQKLLILLDDFQIGYTSEGNKIELREGNENVIGRGGYGATFIFKEDNTFDALKIHKE